MADDPRVILAEMTDRERKVAIGYVRDPQDVPRLLAAVEAVLKLADKWVGDAGNQLMITYNDPALNDAAAAVSHKSASVRRTLAAELRLEILAALTGKDKTDD